MSRVLLLGGTGAMGNNLSRKLAERGYDVYVTTRRERTDTGKIQFVRGNAKDDNFINEALTRLTPDAVIDFMSYGSEEFAARMNVLLKGTGQYVFLSSCRVFAGEDVHTERSPRLLDVCRDAEYLKTDEYALAKARSENLLRESGRENWTIVRPCIAYAYPRLQFGCLEAATFLPRISQKLPVPMPLEMMQKRTTMLHGNDVAEMIARLVFNKKAVGEDFNTVTAENHTWAEVADIYAQAIGLKVVPCSIDDYKTFCNPYQVQYGRMVHHCFDNAKVLAATGLRQTELTTLATGLTKEAKIYLGAKDSVTPDLWRNAMIDRMLGTRMNFSGWSKKMDYARIRYPLFGTVVRIASAIKRRI